MTRASGAKDALGHLIAAKEVVVACGPGGVGKTTTAAALAAGAAQRSPARVLVLTVDPARRLADALGLDGLGHEARPVSLGEVAGREPPKGELYAAMVDPVVSWEALVRRHAPDLAAAGRILANPLYQNITRRFARSYEYIAMERLHELKAEGRFDLLVVDTPPSNDALDFLDAPERMAEFFSSGLLRWLIAPYRSRLLNLASKPFSHIADRVLGTQFLEDIAEFFLMFQQMYEGFVQRAEAVSRLLREPATTYLVVTTLEAAPSVEARRLIGELHQRGLPVGVVVANKALPPSLERPGAAQLAEILLARRDELAKAVSSADRVPVALNDALRLSRVVGAIGRSFGNFSTVARSESTLLGELAAREQVALAVPHLARDVVDLPSLLEVSDHLFGDAPAGSPRAARPRPRRPAKPSERPSTT